MSYMRFPAAGITFALLDSQVATAEVLILTAVVDSTGGRVTLGFNQAVSFVTESDLFVLSDGTVLTYESGDGTSSLVFVATPTIRRNAVLTISYAHIANGWFSVLDGTPLADFSNYPVVNNSVYVPPGVIDLVDGYSNSVYSTQIAVE